MKAPLLSLMVVAPTLLGTSNLAFAEDDAFYTALKGGTPKLNMRLRYEGVDDGNPATDDADALTIRTRLGYQTGKLAGFDAYGEFEDTHIVLGVSDYAPERAGYAVVADPTVTEVNQAFVRYTGGDALKGFMARFGRQRIIFDNARFVGNVGWRQDEQTFDGTKLDYSTDDFSLSAAYLTKVNGITPAFDKFVEDVLVNASWKTAPGGTLTGYSYMLESKDLDDSLDTAGARYDGSLAMDKLALLLTLEYASQSNEISDADTDYSRIEAGVKASGITFKVAQEVLGADGVKGSFQTPLATKHAFNGWADKFLVTPADGLEDKYASVGGMVAGIKLAAVYHKFDADEGRNDYGSEVDLVAVKKFGPYTVGLKYADYNAEDVLTDTNKVWAWTEMSF
jgi:alginate export protein